MKKMIKTIVTVGIIMICAFLFGSIKASAAEPSPRYESLIDMAQVTDFVANDRCLMLYFNDGTGYYWEKDNDVSMDAVAETESDTYIPLDDNLVDMDAVVDFTASEYGLQLYFADGSGYCLER